MDSESKRTFWEGADMHNPHMGTYSATSPKRARTACVGEPMTSQNSSAAVPSHAPAAARTPVSASCSPHSKSGGLDMNCLGHGLQNADGTQHDALSDAAANGTGYSASDCDSDSSLAELLCAAPRPSRRLSAASVLQAQNIRGTSTRATGDSKRSSARARGRGRCRGRGFGRSACRSHAFDGVGVLVIDAHTSATRMQMNIWEKQILLHGGTWCTRLDQHTTHVVCSEWKSSSSTQQSILSFLLAKSGCKRVEDPARDLSSREAVSAVSVILSRYGAVRCTVAWLTSSLMEPVGPRAPDISANTEGWTSPAATTQPKASPVMDADVANLVTLSRKDETTTAKLKMSTASVSSSLIKDVYMEVSSDAVGADEVRRQGLETLPVATAFAAIVTDAHLHRQTPCVGPNLQSSPPMAALAQCFTSRTYPCVFFPGAPAQAADLCAGVAEAADLGEDTPPALPAPPELAQEQRQNAFLERNCASDFGTWGTGLPANVFTAGVGKPFTVKRLAMFACAGANAVAPQASSASITTPGKAHTQSSAGAVLHSACDSVASSGFDSDESGDDDGRLTYTTRDDDASAAASSSYQPNKRIIAELKKMKEIYMVVPKRAVDAKNAHGSTGKGSDPWRVNSYQKAINAIQRISDRGIELTPKNLSEFAKSTYSIGANMQKHILFILENGYFDQVRAYEQQPEVQAMMQFVKIWGVGPSTARRLARDLGLRTIEDVRRVCNGPKPPLTPQQCVGVQCYEDFLERMPRAEVKQIEQVVRMKVLKLRPGAIVMACGSYRRGKERCGDIDVLITHPGGNDDCDILFELVQELKADGFLTHHLTYGSSADDKEGKGLPSWGSTAINNNKHVWGECDSYMGVCRLPIAGSRHRRIDIKAYPFKLYAFAVLHFTGSGRFNRSMRLLARKKGWRLSDKGLVPCIRDRKSKNAILDTGTSVDCRSEEEIFWALGLTFVPPQGRNGDDFREDTEGS